jgi:CO/xanthine dehydrogenase Mo-binding subunit
MTTRCLGAPIARNEDPRLLTGRALFVNDVERPGMLHVAFLRSPDAHARLGTVDLSRVGEWQGVVAAYAADDLGDYWKPGPLLVPPPPVEGTIFNERTQVPLARGKVRYVGEPVAMVVAESRYIAEDALADIGVEYQLLPAVTDLERALTPDSARVHDDVTGNVAARVNQRKGDYEAARQEQSPWAEGLTGWRMGMVSFRLCWRTLRARNDPEKRLAAAVAFIDPPRRRSPLSRCPRSARRDAEIGVCAAAGDRQ